ncbi:MAG: DUF6174 domain-containing protein [Chloroflexota bacterium]
MKAKRKAKNEHQQRWVILLAVTTIAIFMISGLWWLQADSSDATMADAEAQHALFEASYEIARSLWDEQEIDNYRYTITFGHPGGECTTTFTVIDGIATMAEDAGEFCQPYIRFSHIENWSINGLFEQIEQILLAKQCGPNGCECDGYLIVRANYDDSYGYPTLFDYHVTDNAIGIPNTCTEVGLGAIGYPSDIFTIDSLEILSE